MHPLYGLFAAMLLCAGAGHSAAYTSAGITLTGKVSDKKSGMPLPGVTIYLPDLKAGDITDSAGTYLIQNLPRAKVTVQVSMVGYRLIMDVVDLTQTFTKDFLLEQSVNELHEVVVTGLSGAAEKLRTPAPFITIPRIEMLQVASTGLIDALAKKPGVSQVSTGAGISKPVIRGLGYNRVVVVHDGIRQEGQQWGDEHGIEIDEAGIYQVEILKGPASLAYGSDALAGVISLVSAPTAPEGKINGSMLLNYQSNNGLAAASANVAGKIKGFVWDIRYSTKVSHAYRNRYDGYIFNSGFRENSVSGVLGINRKWGYAHVHVGMFQFRPGIITGDRDPLTGKFIREVKLNDSSSTETVSPGNFRSYHQYIPYQHVRHSKAVLNSGLMIRNGMLKMIAGFQQNSRKEFGDVLAPENYALYFLLNTFNYDVRYVFPQIRKINITAGISGMQQQSENKGIEFLVPAYRLSDVGFFGIIKKNMGKVDIAGGLRYDMRFQDGHELTVDQDGNPVGSGTPGSEIQFPGFHAAFTAFSGSLGGVYQVSDLVRTGMNISRGFRAPNIAELGSNGLHEGTFRYEIGNTSLKPETSFQADVFAGIHSEHLSAGIDLFSNSISGYIFPQKLVSSTGTDSVNDGFLVYQYVSRNARLQGGEISTDIHPHPFDWLHFENTFAFVNGIFPGEKSESSLPFIPSPRLTSSLRADIRKLSRNFTNSYAMVGVEAYFTQNKVSNTYGAETPTNGYVLLNIGAGTDVKSGKKHILSIYASVNNLTDVAYQHHLSRLKYTALNEVTGRTGVYNMGRNFSLKILVPFNIK